MSPPAPMYEDPRDSGSKLSKLCGYLADTETSPLNRYKSSSTNRADVDAVFDVRCVLQRPHREMEIGDLHPLLRPRKGRYGLVDYEKVFCDEAADSKGHESIFDARGVARGKGCMVVARPDQYVSAVLQVGEEGWGELERFFAGFMKPTKALSR